MILQFRNVTKIYGKGENSFVALDKVSLAITRGESIAILGKSGSGKSTLMHIMAALDLPNSGSVLFEDVPYRKLTPKDQDTLRSQRFGFIFQQFFLNGRETVLENVMLPLKIAGTNRKDRRVRALEALGEVELLDKQNNKATDLSGGQKQRVAIARALVGKPDVIFADEPTGNLDSETGAHVEDLLFRLNREKGITLIIVTHDEDLAAKCQRRLRMKDGRIVEEAKQ